ncbi:MFS transporter [Pseudonocardia kongjuensis]|uniref:MFS transporter n=1 Tax=Pseudonocardia kongjuensis TaxID=102227 RepID=A0ABN1Y0T5_9PSEU
MGTTSYGPGPATAAGEFRRSWPALIGATIGIGFGIGGFTFYTNGLFIPSLEAEFGWSRTALSSVPLFGYLVHIVVLPFVGSLVDRFGARLPGVLGLLALAAGYFALAEIGPTFTGFLLLWTLIYLMSATSTPVSFTRTVNERFDRARGLALGIALGANGFLAFLVPLTLGTLIADDWRWGYRVLAIAVLVATVVVLLLVPGRDAAARAGATPATGDRLPIGSLVRSRLFWQVATSFLVVSLAVGGMAVHLVPLLRDNGVDAGSAASVASLVGIAVIVGRLGAGYLVDRIFAPRVAAGVVVVAAAGFLALAVGGPAFAPLTAIGVGLALGAEIDFMSYLTARYFGMRLYGRMIGVFYGFFLLGIGSSPLLISTLRDLTGTYTLSLFTSVALLVAAAAIFLTMPRFPVPAGAGPADDDTRDPAGGATGRQPA